MMSACRVLVAFVLGLFCNVSANADTAWLDRSHRAFVPTEISAQVETQSDFPLLWWNFVVLDAPADREPDWASLQDQCIRWRDMNRDRVRLVFCGSQLPPLQERVLDWSLDSLRRHPAPTRAALEILMNASLAKASLPIGSLVSLLRLDPFGSLGEMQGLLQQKMNLPFGSHQGFLFDRASRRILIPAQLAFSASESSRTIEVEKTLSVFETGGGHPPILLGAHAVAAENETQVRADLEVVSKVSTIVLGLLILVILSTRRGRVLLIIPLLLASMALAAGLTVVVFGHIHGLCLAFGPAIVGLAIDFGLHVAFSNQARKLWRANLFGLLTTLSVLVVMIFSRIPLLQQLMFFSTSGLIFGYLIQYFVFKWKPDVFSARPYSLHTPRNSSLVIVVAILSLCAIAGPLIVPLTLDMRALNYETPRRAELNRWFYESSGGISPLLETTTQTSTPPEQISPLEIAAADRDWANAQDLPVNSIAALLPSPSIQATNLAGWRNLLCSPHAVALTAEQADFFSPFFERFHCDDLRPRLLLPGEPIPAYLEDFHHDSSWLTLWLPRTTTQSLAVKARVPQAFSFTDLALSFPKVLGFELAWMVPSALLLAFFFLLYYYRSLGLALLASTPFFSGVGLYVVVSQISGTPTTFIGMIGLIMVFGFSLDYGIFATDLVRRERDKPDPGIWSGLAIGTLANIAGFTPLIFGHHPVLRSLGQTLLCGTIGCFFGSIGGIPGLYQWLGPRLERPRPSRGRNE